MMNSTYLAKTRRFKGHLRVTTRIYLSVIIFILLLAGLATTVLLGIQSTRESFSEYARVGRIASDVNSIDQTVEELQRQAVTFSSTGNPSAPERVRALGIKLQNSIEATREKAQQEKTLYHLDQMEKHLEVYLSKFEQVVEERHLRSQLVREEMRNQVTELERLVGSIIEEQDQPIDPQVAEQLLCQLLLAKISAYQYLIDPNGEHVEMTILRLNRIVTTLAELRDKGNDTEEIQELLALTSRFRQVFVRAVQATRGYLYLVSVVMAGEAAEFVWQSDQIRKVANENLALSQVASETRSQAVAQRVLWFSVLTLIASFTISWFLVKKVVNPISNITSTLVTLTENKEVSSIPELNRRDEIGDMARAAEVFRQKNEQTVQLLEKATRLSDRLEQSNRDLDSFAYVASHDLKSPLRAIDNISSWLVEDVGEIIPDESVTHLTQLRQRVRRMESLLDDLLQYSRAGRVPVPLEEVDTNILIQSIQETIDWPEDMKLTVIDPMPSLTTERGTLQRILLNLMTNAVKYRGATDPTLVVSAEEQGDFFEFVLKDNGIGISPDYHERIFKMFQRVHKQKAIDGSGMGLALIKKLINNVGGEIGVESAEGLGATFRFTWPKQIPTATEVELTAS